MTAGGATLSAVLFDLDDTLYDYQQYAEAGLDAAADRVEEISGVRVHDELRDLYFDDDVTEGTFDVLLRRHDLAGVDVAALVEAFHDETGDLEPYAEAERVLDALGRDHRLGLVTDGRGGHDKLDSLGVREHFDAVLVTPTIGASKHERGVFDRTLADLDVAPENAAYVGDDPRVDFRVPNELGMTTVRLRRGRYVHLDHDDPDAAPDHEIDDVADLLTDVPAFVGASERSD